MTTLQIILLIFFLILLLSGPRAILRVLGSLLVLACLAGIAAFGLSKWEDYDFQKRKAEQTFHPEKFSPAEWQHFEELTEWEYTQGASAGLPPRTEYKGHPKTNQVDSGGLPIVRTKTDYEALPNHSWFKWFWGYNLYWKEEK
jgi:hypothetical protein